MTFIAPEKHVSCSQFRFRNALPVQSWKRDQTADQTTEHQSALPVTGNQNISIRKRGSSQEFLDR